MGGVKIAAGLTVFSFRGFFVVVAVVVVFVFHEKVLNVAGILLSSRALLIFGAHSATRQSSAQRLKTN